jgi:surfeit locus 1 family protein
MYRFMWRPAWIVSHVLVLALIVAMINLGLWQVRRLQEKQDRNERIEQNTVAEPLSVPEAEAVVARDGAKAATYRQVASTGTYDVGAEVAIRGRSLDGAPGRWVVTPFIPAGGGDSVLVVRGWISEAVDDTEMPIEDVAPPEGEVSILGYLMPAQTRGSFGSTDPAEGRLDELARVDVARVDQQYAGDLAPFWVQLANQQPPTEGDAIHPVPLPALDDGPHLAYAVQWGIFTIIAIGGYPMILRRVARQKASEADDEPEQPDDPPAPGESRELEEPVG